MIIISEIIQSESKKMNLEKTFHLIISAAILSLKISLSPLIHHIYTFIHHIYHIYTFDATRKVVCDRTLAMEMKNVQQTNEVKFA